MEQQQYVGIDLHRRRSVIVRVDEHGEHSAPVRIDNDAVALAAEVAKAGEHRCRRAPPHRRRRPSTRQSAPPRR